LTDEPDPASLPVPPTTASYGALLRVPELPRILTSMAIARTAGAMTSIAIVLFTLSQYHSPALAGLVTFASIMPGVLASPIAGALLDRHGRTRLVTLDYLVASGSLILIGALATADALPAWLLVLISATSSLTGPLSNTGLRSLFPIMVPEYLWERVNAVDSNAYVASTLVGPPIAAALVQLAGGPTTLIVIGLMFAAAALVVAWTKEPPTEIVTSGRLLRDALDGLLYVLRNPTIRGLGLTMTTLNLGGGVLTIVIPIIVLERAGASPAFVGVAWALAGATGILTALYFGRLDSRGHERSWLVLATLGSAGAMAILLLNESLAVLLVAMAIYGLMTGPGDIALFTLRQRRTDPAWMGRAFAVSASINFAGFPIGSAISGALVEHSLEIAIAIGVAASLIAALFAWWQIPLEQASALPDPNA
jgi:MFS family permease